MCPKGDDPLTQGLSTKSIIITTGTLYDHAPLGPRTGNFLLQFNGHSISFPSDPRAWSAMDCQAAFERLENVKSATCSRGGIGKGGGTTYTVVFHKFSTISRDNNIYNNDGTFSSWNMSCITSLIRNAASPYCTITDASISPEIAGLLFFK